MGGGKRPGSARLHQRVGLLIVGQMQAEGAAEPDIVNDEDRPDARLDRFRIGQRHDGRVDVPDRLEIALDLQIDRRSDPREIRQGNRT